MCDEELAAGDFSHVAAGAGWFVLVYRRTTEPPGDYEVLRYPIISWRIELCGFEERLYPVTLPRTQGSDETILMPDGLTQRLLEQRVLSEPEWLEDAMEKAPPYPTSGPWSQLNSR